MDEAEAAVEWYRRRSVRAAEMFVDELDRAIERIGEHPRQFPEYAFGTRRMSLRRFPYLVIFRETAGGVESLLWHTDVAAPGIGGIEWNNASAFIAHSDIALKPELRVVCTISPRKSHRVCDGQGNIGGHMGCAMGVCQDESGIIISGALRRLTVSGSKPDKNALHRRIKCGRTISGSQR